MAEKATGDSVAADIRPPDYRKAVQLMRGDIKKKKDRISGINGEIADTWGKIQGFKVTKPAGRIFMALDAMEDDERQETIRCLNGLMGASGWAEPQADLADIASGERVENRLGRGDVDEVDGGEGGDEDEEREEKGGVAGLAKARRHLGGGEPAAKPH